MNHTHRMVESQARQLVDALLGWADTDRFSLGIKHRVSAGSGVDSGKIVMVVPISVIGMKQMGGGLIPDISGHYKPVDWSREVPVRFEDGTLGTMFKDRLIPV